MNPAATLLEPLLPGCGLADGALAARALVAAGAPAQARRLHERLAALSESAPGLWAPALWLWALGEDWARLPDPSPLLPTVRRLLLRLMATWEQPGPGPWGEAAAQRYTAAAGAFYGACRALGQLLPDLETAPLLRAVREHVFARCTTGDRLARWAGGRGLDAALLLLVPFGLFFPEDLLMVATVAALEAELTAPGGGLRRHDGDGGPASLAATAWLAHYWQVKGTSPARLDALRTWLAQQTPATLLDAAALAALRAQRAQTRFEHLPRGHDHPYHRYTVERTPRDPRAGEPVVLQVAVDPVPPAVTVLWERNGRPMPPLDARWVPPGESEGHWRAELGTFAPGDRVTYRFRAGGAVSADYGFDVLFADAVAAFTAAACDGRELVLAARDRLGVAAPRLRLSQPAPGVLALRLEVGEGVRGWRAVQAPAALPVDWQPDAPGGVSGWLRAGELRVRVQADPVRLEVYAGEQQLLAEADWQWLQDGAGRIVRVQRRPAVAAESRWYGGGERFDRLERTGTRVLNTVYNQYKEQGDRTYLPVPLFWSSLGFGLYVDTAFTGEIELSAGAIGLDFAAAEEPAAGLDCYLLTGGLAAGLQRYAALVGRPVLPPRWAFGPWMSSNNWDSQAAVERQAALTRQHDVPATVLVVEAWSDEATFYLFNDARRAVPASGPPPALADLVFPEWGRWPDPKGMVERLHAQGLRVVFWQIPVWKDLNGLAHPQRDADAALLVQSGWCVRCADGTPYRIPEGWFKHSLLIDFTHPEAARWWLAQRRYLLAEVGIDGLKTDGGEFVWDREVRFAGGYSGAEGRNLYPLWYEAACHALVQECRGGDGVLFSRAGYTGAQRWPLHWAGDAPSTFAAFRSQLIAGLTAALAGIPFWGWDLAGFSGDIPSAELYCRAAAMACFCPVMQYHAESKAEQDQDRTPWNIVARTGRPEALAVYRYFAHLRLNLLPYIYSEAIKAAATGLPMLRPLCLDFPDDPVARELADEYLFGEALLVAPVLTEGAAGRRLYLPAGAWYDFWTGAPVAGGRWLWQEVPWERIPVFVRAGTVLPLHLAPGRGLGEGMVGAPLTPAEVTLRVYPPPPGEPAASVWYPGPENAVRLAVQSGAQAVVLSADDLPLSARVALARAPERVVAVPPGPLRLCLPAGE